MNSDVEQQPSSSHNPRQIIATVVCVIVLATLAWFWNEQVQEVIEMLELAYGDGS
ncbi:MAG: hypothetical protein ISP99_06005 [Pseudomonadales bacterium]|nr:hypothetical protein [Pseudomonadales bacterium]MBL6814312.1 hypothetical protein [Pseudomonadales bacterium]